MTYISWFHFIGIGRFRIFGGGGGGGGGGGQGLEYWGGGQGGGQITSRHMTSYGRRCDVTSHGRHFDVMCPLGF